MQVSEAMTRGVEVVHPETTLQSAAETMHQLNVGPLPVCGEDGKLVGMITDRDITIRGAAEGRDPYTTFVRDVMTSDVVYCFEDQDIAEATRIMEQKQVRRLPVLDRNRNLIGILSLGDVALSGIDEQVTADTLEAVSEPDAATPQRSA